MIQLIKAVTIIIICCITVNFSVAQEDYFSPEQSREYATYLFKNREYDLAFKELDRIVTTQRQDTASMRMFLLSSKRSHQYEAGIRRFEQLNETSLINSAINTHYYQLLLLNRKLEDLSRHLQNETTSNTTLKLEMSVSLIQRDWDKTTTLLTTYNAADKVEFQHLLTEAQKMKLKKPWLAGTMSTFIPGSGKIYTGYWKDALFSMLFISTTSYQAYRGFNKKGTSSVYPWVYAGISTGFYLGNIYGSHKSAHTRNHQIKRYVDEKVDALYFP